MCWLCGKQESSQTTQTTTDKSDNVNLCVASGADAADIGVDAVVNHCENAVVKLLNGDEMKDLEKTYNDVKKAIYSIPPKYRTIKAQHPMWKIDLSDTKEKDEERVIAKVRQHIMNEIKSKLKAETLSLRLEQQLEFVLSAAAIKQIPEKTRQYCDIKLSGDYGGESYIRAGVIGMYRIKQEVLIYAALYCEKWVEEKNVAINTEDSIWAAENVGKFAKYLLIKQIRKDSEKMIKVAKQEENKMTKRKMLRIEQENGMELYQWLESINLTDYYNHFYQQGFTTKMTIAKIDRETLQNDLKITELGRIYQFEAGIAKLKQELYGRLGNVSNCE